jgi:WD40 repeat protein
LRAAIYARVSTADQRVESQLYDLRELATKRGFEVVKEYQDCGVSGLNRPHVSPSPDGKTLATTVVQAKGEAIKIALLEIGSSSPPRMLDANPHISGNVQFLPDGKSVAYSIRADNVWVQPVDGSEGRAITNFKSEQIWSTSFSPDGKSFAVLRGHYDSDVVLLQEAK